MLVFKRWRIVFLIILGFAVSGYISAVFAYNSQEKSPVATVKHSAVSTPAPDIYKLWSLTNKERREAGLQPLALNSVLDSSAQSKCKDMAKKHYFDHNTPSGDTPWLFFKKAGITSYRALGENLAEGFTDERDTIDGWMASKEHRKNILDSRYTDVGFGICEQSHNSWFVVQHFYAK